MTQQEIIDAAREQGLVIGHDGAIYAEHIEEIAEPEGPCPCEGTGEMPVTFGGRVIEVVPCPRGCGT